MLTEPKIIYSTLLITQCVSLHMHCLTNYVFIKCQISSCHHLFLLFSLLLTFHVVSDPATST